MSELISVRLDDDAQRALAALEATGLSRSEDSATVIPSATIPTTVATGIRRPRMQGTPPCILGSVVIRSNVMATLLAPAANALTGPRGR